MKPLMDFSQFGQPRAFRRFLPLDAPRYVMDVGAHDGVTGSNSREFVLEGWKALLVEPLPSVFARLRANSRGLSNTTCIQAACAERAGRGRLYVGTGGDNTQNSTLSTDEQLAFQRSACEIEVELATATQLLELHRWPARIGLLLVDAEGFDLEVLQGLDATRFRPDVIVTEEYENNPGKQSRKFELLRTYGYRYCGVCGSDSIWRNASLAPGPVMSGELFCGSSLPEKFAALRSKGPGEVWYDDPPLRPGAAPATVSRCGKAAVSGWAFDPARQAAPPYVFLRVRELETGGVEVIQGHRVYRPDVADHFKTERLAEAGFRFDLPARDRRGTYAVALIQAGDGELLDSGETVAFDVAAPPENAMAAELAQRFLAGSGLHLGEPQSTFALPPGCTVKDMAQIAGLEHVAPGSQRFIICNRYLEECEEPENALAACLGVLDCGGALFILSRMGPLGRFDSAEEFLQFLRHARVAPAALAVWGDAAIAVIRK